MAFLLGWILLACSEVRAQLTATDRQTLLDGHNAARRSVSTPSMIELVYDMKLECVAQAYLNSLPGTWQTNTFSHNAARSTMYATCGGSGYVGENWCTYGPDQAVNCWTDMLWGTCSERMAYNGALNTLGQNCSGLEETGHYTQVTWANTAAVGCGWTAAYGVLCDYAPGGNYQGENPYTIGTPCSACPADHPVCDNGLCTVSGGSPAPAPAPPAPAPAPPAPAPAPPAPAPAPPAPAPAPPAPAPAPPAPAPAPPAPAPSPSCPGGWSWSGYYSTSYVAVQGDTCASVATKFGITLANFQAENSGVVCTCPLIVGQRVNVVTSAPAPAAPAPAPAPSPSCPGGWSWSGYYSTSYVAVKGDTCASVATKFRLTVAKFQAENSGVVCTCPLIVGQRVNVAPSSFLEEGSNAAKEDEMRAEEAWGDRIPRLAHSTPLAPVRGGGIKSTLAFRAGLKV